MSRRDRSGLKETLYVVVWAGAVFLGIMCAYGWLRLAGVIK